MMQTSGTALHANPGDRFVCFIFSPLIPYTREHGYNQQALYCYRKVYSLDPTNVDALWDRASLAKETGDLKTVNFTLTSHELLLVMMLINFN
jgi:hypothetical protein